MQPTQISFILRSEDKPKIAVCFDKFLRYQQFQQIYIKMLKRKAAQIHGESNPNFRL